MHTSILGLNVWGEARLGFYGGGEGGGGVGEKVSAQHGAVMSGGN